MASNNQVNPGIGSRRAATSLAFQQKLQQMRLTLAPLVKVTTGQVHPDFPATLLGFWLLTNGQLESLASFYHQRTPCHWTYQYPCPIRWSSDLPIEDKRRKIGKFIGLRGCETPPPVLSGKATRDCESLASCGSSGEEEAGCEPPLRLMSEEEIMAHTRRACARQDEEEAMRRKLLWYQ